MIRIPLGLALLATLLVSEAWAETVPIPRQKPPRPEAASVASVPIPRPNPRRAPKRQETRHETATWPGAGDGWPASEVTAARKACAATLNGLDVSYAPLEPIGQSAGCGTPAPIALSAVAGVSLDPPATVNCDVALALHQWVTGTVQPAARKRLKTEVTEIHVAASYVCRRRNNAASGKLSEHGRANAIDMSGFSFSRKEAVAVEGSWGDGLLASIGLSKGGSFLNDIRSGACGMFTTVLGPGSDPYHGDHFHVDVLQRKGGYRICK